MFVLFCFIYIADQLPPLFSTYHTWRLSYNVTSHFRAILDVITQVIFEALLTNTGPKEDTNTGPKEEADTDTSEQDQVNLSCVLYQIYLMLIL